MYELHFRDTSAAATTVTAAAAATPPPAFTLARMAEAVDLEARLAARERLPPAELDAALAARSDAHSPGREGFVPAFPLDRLFPGVFYLEGVGPDRVRVYGRRPKDAPRARGGGPLAPALVSKAAAAAEEEAATTATTVSGTEASNSGEDEDEEDGAGRSGAAATAAAASAAAGAVVAEAPSSDSSLVNGAGTKTAPAAAAATSAAAAGSKAGAVAAAAAATPPAPPLSLSASSGARIGATLPRVVVTGVACGLPGQDEVFEQDNLARLLGGQECVQRLSPGSTAALVEKNVVQVRAEPALEACGVVKKG